MNYKLIQSSFMKLSVLILITILLFLSYSLLAKNNAQNPHKIKTIDLKASVTCTSCHIDEPTTELTSSGQHLIPKIELFNKPENEMCSTCHGDDNTSHIIGVTPEYNVPADLPLDQSKEMTCLTCHYVHGNLKSEKPMASSSFMDHLFDRARLEKSFLLRRNNANGDLCLACHSK